MPFPKLSTVLLGCLLAAVFATPAGAYSSFQMGIHDPTASGGADLPFDRARDAGASITRTAVHWHVIAPGGASKPAGFDARNPADPAYNWAELDAFVRAAGQRDLDPLVTSYTAPDWAEGYDAADRAKRKGEAGTYRPNPQDYGDFLHAAATRYNGKFPDPANPGRTLPRVKYWQLWNEPNFGQYLLGKSKRETPAVYSRLLGAGYKALKGVSKSNLVLAAGLGPYGNNGYATDVEPQFFMREVLCLTGKAGSRLKKKRRCGGPKARFDVWTQHPYTFTGRPTSDAGAPDSAVIGDMDQVRRTLKYAVRKRTVSPRGNKRLWVSEFGWFSNPPGIKAGDGRELGKPLSVQAAYLSESAYRLWRDGFSAMVWYETVDLAAFPTGLYTADGKPKPALDAFKFPFFADVSRGRVLFWGLASRSGRSTVRIEKRRGSRWKRVVDVRSDSRGMIYTRIRGGRGTYRAVVRKGDKAGLTSYRFKAR